MAAHDGTDDEAKKKKRLVTWQVALAKQDEEQAKIIRGWADELDAAAAAGDWNAVRAKAKGMRNAAEIVEMFTTGLLERLGAL